MTVDDRMPAFAAEQHRGVPAAIRRNGRPQLSGVGCAHGRVQG